MKFEENQHPRDGDGKFKKGDGNNSKQKQEKMREAIKKYSDTPKLDMAELGVDKPREDISGLLGKEFTGFKGQQAIDKLMQEKQGHIKGAFHREDLGDIDLIWGDDKVGLQHILKRREAEGIQLNNFMNDIAEVIENGIFHNKSERGDIEFWKSGKMVVIAPEYHGNKITYLLTAFKRTKIKTPH